MVLLRQRWCFLAANSSVDSGAVATELPPLLQQVLWNRGIQSTDTAQEHCQPEQQALPSPLEVFPDLPKSVALLSQAIDQQQKIAICGDYDADGMTSTALLLRAIRHLGGTVEYAIPSRMKDGYGINRRIVQSFAERGFGLILTVDNGIAAHDAIAAAKELGLTVIITDHHDLPDQLPIADAILNPKLLPQDSVYAGLAGVGVAYVLAVCTAQARDAISGLTQPLLELFTLGTIADLAPLVGVNRRWLRRGLKSLPKSKLVGVQALMQVAGIDEAQKSLNPDDIGFRLGPRINAIGRIGDPKVVIDLLTTDNPEDAYAWALICESINRQRQDLCQTIEAEAIALVEETPLDWKADWVLTPMQPGWHHGVIGIVASRLVERYGVPVFIATEEEGESIRGSARGIPEFNVYEALAYCRDSLEKFGGHRAAGGFSVKPENWPTFQMQLREFAHGCLEPGHLKPLVNIDAQARFSELDLSLVATIESLHPWGIGNEYPIFWTPNVQMEEQYTMGKKKNHLRLLLSDSSDSPPIKAIAWRWGDYFPLPSVVDIAYKVQKNHYNGETSLQLELVGVRAPGQQSPSVTPIAIKPETVHGNWQGGWALGLRSAAYPWADTILKTFRHHDPTPLPAIVATVIHHLRQSPALPYIQQLLALPSPSPLWQACLTQIATALDLPLFIDELHQLTEGKLPPQQDFTNQYCLLLATQFKSGELLQQATTTLLTRGQAKRVSVLTLLQ